MTNTPSVSFSKCEAKACLESAISFSPYCWAHTSKTDYLPKLREGIRTLAGDPRPLNLKKVDCSGIDLSNLDLRHSCFSQASVSHGSFIGANLFDCDMIGAKFIHCDFVGADMKRSNLTRATIEHSSLSFADLQYSCWTEASFKETDFMGALLFNSSMWNADLAGVKHLKKKNFQDPKSGKRNAQACFLEREPLVACESYRMLKHYFYRNGLYEDASWAAYRELTMERKHFFKTRDLRYFPSLFMDILSGYTEKPARVILSAFVIVLLFGFLYFIFDASAPSRGDVRVHTGFWDNLYFSFITFTTVGFGDFAPRPVIWFRLLACLEAFSGPFMAGLYIFTLTRRYAAN